MYHLSKYLQAPSSPPQEEKMMLVIEKMTQSAPWWRCLCSLIQLLLTLHQQLVSIITPKISISTISGISSCTCWRCQCSSWFHPQVWFDHCRIQLLTVLVASQVSTYYLEFPPVPHSLLQSSSTQCLKLHLNWNLHLSWNLLQWPNIHPRSDFPLCPIRPVLLSPPLTGREASLTNLPRAAVSGSARRRRKKESSRLAF